MTNTRPFEHRFQTDPEHGAQLACANFSFGSSAQSPLAAQCGRLAVVNRLFEVILVHILRVLLTQTGVPRETNAEPVDGGLLAGLSQPKLALGLNAMHAQPARPWRLADLAQTAHMSRSSFAALFYSTSKITPGEYLLRWRMCVAQDALRRGKSLRQVQIDTGYRSAASFTRAFKDYSGVAPKAWAAENN